MSRRAHTLAEQFEQANAEFMSFVARISDDEWRLLCPSEGRTVAALAHHVAAGYPFEIRVFNAIVAGKPLPVLSRAALDAMNAADGVAHAGSDRAETLELLRANGASAATFVRDLNDDDLTRTGAYIEGILAMSVDQWIERVLIGHIRGHLASMRTVVEDPAGTVS